MRHLSDTDYLYLSECCDLSLAAFTGIATRFGSLFLLLDIRVALGGCATFCVMFLFCHYLANLLWLGWQIILPVSSSEDRNLRANGFSAALRY
jgi:hypothetical protein